MTSILTLPDRTNTTLAATVDAALELRHHMGERAAITLLTRSGASDAMVARVLRDPTRRRSLGVDLPRASR